MSEAAEVVKRLSAELDVAGYRLREEQRMREEAEAAATRAISQCAVKVSHAWERAVRIAMEAGAGDVAEKIRQAALMDP